MTTYFQEEPQEAQKPQEKQAPPSPGSGGSGDDLKKVGKIILTALPCLCAFAVMGVYVLELLPRLNLTAVNLICLFLACLKLFPGIASVINRRKAGSFVSSLAIALAALAVNLRGQMPKSLSALSVWEVLWAGMAAVSVACLAAVLLRLLRWSQENWEQEREAVQSRRRERRENRREWWRNWRQYWAGRLTARHEYARSRAEARQDYKKSLENQQMAERLSRTKTQIAYRKYLLYKALGWRPAPKGQSSDKKPAEDPKPKHSQNLSESDSGESEKLPQPYRELSQKGLVIIMVGSFLFVCGIAALLIWIPTIDGLNDGISNWFRAVKTMMEPFMDLSAGEGKAIGKETAHIIKAGSAGGGNMATVGMAIVYYLMTVILCVTILAVATYLVGVFIKRFWTGTLFDSNDEENEEKKVTLLATYANPFSVLLVSFIGLYALSRGNIIDIRGISKGWTALLFTIIFILCLLTAFEIVRLVLEQCGRRDSVLRRTIYLVFLTVLDFLNQIIFSVFRDLHIKNFLSSLMSLLSLVLPGEPSEIPARALEKVEKILKNEIDAVSETGGKFKNRYGFIVGNRHSTFTGDGKAAKDIPRTERVFRRKVWERK